MARPLSPAEAQATGAYSCYSVWMTSGDAATVWAHSAAEAVVWVEEHLHLEGELQRIRKATSQAPWSGDHVAQ